MAESSKALQTAHRTQETVLAKLKEFSSKGDLRFPADYSPENAVKSAWSIIQDTVDRNSKPAVEVCTQASIANALFRMVQMGLNPDKSQCYFIVRGNKLMCQRSYFGSASVAKRVDSNVKEFNAMPVYEGDKLTTEIRNGKRYVVAHEQQLENIDDRKITGAYCTVVCADNNNYSVYMPMEKILGAWKKSQQRPVDDKGNLRPGTAHYEYTSEFCCRTVISKAANKIINESDDGNLLAHVAKENDQELAEIEVEVEIQAEENQGDFVDVDFQEVPPDTAPDTEAETPSPPAEQAEQAEKKQAPPPF